MNVLRGAKNYVTGALGFSSGETRYGSLLLPRC